MQRFGSEVMTSIRTRAERSGVRYRNRKAIVLEFAGNNVAFRSAESSGSWTGDPLC